MPHNNLGTTQHGAAPISELKAAAHRLTTKECSASPMRCCSALADRGLPPDLLRPGTSPAPGTPGTTATPRPPASGGSVKPLSGG